MGFVCTVPILGTGSIYRELQGSLLFPKIEFFINLIFEVGVFYKHGQCIFFIKRGSFFYKKLTVYMKFSNFGVKKELFLLNVTDFI